MNCVQKVFIDFLKNNKHLENELSSLEYAQLYVISALSTSAIEFIEEQLWLERKNDPDASFDNILSPLFLDELKYLEFLKDILLENGEKLIKSLRPTAVKLETESIERILKRDYQEQKVFLTYALHEMNSLFIKEENDQKDQTEFDGHKGIRLYRTFDRLDDIFKLDYELDLNMVVDHDTKERLYQRSGVGVQSGYSTILLALENIGLKDRGIIIDLGSGYGRVGLVYSLMRPDLQFIGYEYVEHRVELSNEAARNFQLENNLNFKIQDLSLEDFKIPKADVYYMYDPFTKETYDYVLDQIVEISKESKVVIVTKGNARKWLLDIASANSWPKPQYLDKGNLCIFQSS